MISKNNSCSVLAEIFSVRLQYSDLIKSGQFAIPKKYHQLTDESADWCLNRLDILNGNHLRAEDLKNLCRYYTELITYSNEFKRYVTFTDLEELEEV